MDEFDSDFYDRSDPDGGECDCDMCSCLETWGIEHTLAFIAFIALVAFGGMMLLEYYGFPPS